MSLRFGLYFSEEEIKLIKEIALKEKCVTHQGAHKGTPKLQKFCRTIVLKYCKFKKQKMEETNIKNENDTDNIEKKY